MSFLNKVIFITHAGSGIGEKIALHFARLSARLSLIDPDANNLKIVAEKCQNLSKTKVFKVVADFTIDDDVKQAVELTVQEYGRIDIVINCAEVNRPGKILDKNLVEPFDEVLKITVRAQALITHLTAPALIKTKGNIVNISRLSSTINETLQTDIPNTVSKACLNHFTRCVALELATKDVRVNSIYAIQPKEDVKSDSHIPADNKTKSHGEGVNHTFPLKRSVKMEDIAELASFLASDKATGMTGGTYGVDSGFALIGGKVLMVN